MGLRVGGITGEGVTCDSGGNNQTKGGETDGEFHRTELLSGVNSMELAFFHAASGIERLLILVQLFHRN